MTNEKTIAYFDNGITLLERCIIILAVAKLLTLNIYDGQQYVCYY